jgi:hypothetical protein
MATTSTSFKKGEGGRKPGSLNRLTRTVKECVLEAFNELQNDPQNKLIAFAKKNPKEFYQIAARLIPTELTGNVRQKIVVKID